MSGGRHEMISIPTEKFRTQNPIFHEFYRELRTHGFDAADFHVRGLLRRELSLFHVHFPEHFASNYPPAQAAARCSALIGAMLLCKARRIPIVWTVHNVTPFESKNPHIYDAMMNVTLRLVDACVFLSRSSEEAFEKRFHQASPCARALIPHPAYPIDVSELPAPQPLRLGMIGEQKPYKRPLASLDLFAIARSMRRDCELLVAGPVHEAEEFASALRRLAPAAEWIDRRFSDDELVTATQHVHFVLLPYSLITNSGAALHALSCGRPIVTANLPLFRELREHFGAAWVRIADGAERTHEFWEPPRSEDLPRLRQKLCEISLERTAASHAAFFSELITRRASPMA